MLSFNEQESTVNKLIFGKGNERIAFVFDDEPVTVKEILNVSDVDDILNHNNGDVDVLTSRLERDYKHTNRRISKKLINKLKESPLDTTTKNSAIKELYTKIKGNTKSLQLREIQNFYLSVLLRSKFEHQDISDSAIIDSIIFRYGEKFSGWKTREQIYKRSEFSKFREEIKTRLF